MLHRGTVPFVVVTLCALLGATASVAQTPEIAIEISVEREVTRVDEAGRSVVATEPVDAARPGDVLIYTLSAVNRGVAPALGARIVDPIPEGTVLLVDELAAGDRPTVVSLDGGSSWQDFPARIEQVDGGGSVRLVAAPAAAYTHLRWDLTAPLGPGETHDVSFKVRVN